MEAFPPGCFQKGQPCALNLCDSLPLGGSADAPEPLTLGRFHMTPGVVPTPSDQPLTLGGTPLGFSLDDITDLLQSSACLLSFVEATLLCPAMSEWSASTCRAKLRDLASTHVPGTLLCFTDGSFTEGRSHCASTCGWACVFVDPHASQISVAFGAVEARLCAEPYTPSPFVGECAALLHACLIACSVFCHRPVSFLSDCTSAVDIARGAAAYEPGGIGQAMRNTFDFRRTIFVQPDTVEHIPGHAGHFGNELADRLSKHGALSLKPSCGLALSDSLLRLWLVEGARLLPWAATAIRSNLGDPALPRLNSEWLGQDTNHFGLSTRQLFEPFLPIGACSVRLQGGPTPSVAEASTMQAAAPVTCTQLTLATFNVLSLNDGFGGPASGQVVGEGLAMQPGRAQMLAAQLDDHHIHAACLQETRCDSGTYHCGRYLRFCSGGLRGQWGVEWWFKDGFAFRTSGAAQDPANHVFREPLFTVVASDPRRLLVRFADKAVRTLFVGLHAPHRATEASVLEQWWSETHALIRNHAMRDSIVLAGDFNASVGSHPSDQVGGHAAESEDAAGEALHSVLQEFDLLIPATWEDFHTGASHTYVQKRNGQLCRPDMVCIPSAWCKEYCRSYLAPQLHTAHCSPDHTAAVVEVQFHCRAGQAGPALRQRRFPVSHFTDPANRATIEAALKRFQPLPWDCSVHAHAAHLVGYVQQTLGSIKSKRAVGPHQSYLSQDTWQLQRAVAATRRSLHRLQRQVYMQLTAMRFRVWRGIDMFSSLVGGTVWWRRADLALAAHLSVLRHQGQQLKTACKRDRNNHLSLLADQISSSPSSEVFGNLHRLLSHKRKKPYRADPLPSIRDAAGNVCPDSDSSLRRWRQHFGGLEGGKEIELGQFIADSHSRICQRAMSGGSWPAPSDVRLLPTCADIHRLLVKAKPAKCPGMDGIPNEFGRVFAEFLSPHLHHLALKTSWRGAEAIGCKAGQAIWLYKGKGSFQECTSYRSILLLPVWSKIVHQALRPPMKRFFEQHAPSLQLGGKSKCTVMFGSQLIRALGRVATATGTTHFTLFADIASAFYCVIQRLVANTAATADGFDPDGFLDSLQLSSDEREAVAQHLAEPTALARGGAPPWLEALTCSLQEGNFFCLKGDTTVIATAKGSRPGSSWADLIFAALIKRILLRRDQLREACHHVSQPPSFPWDGRRSFQPCDTDSDHIQISEVVWADDIAIPRLTTPHLAACAMGVEASCLSEALHEFGFTLSFAPSKTAAVLTLSGPGSRRAKQAVFGPSGLRGHVPVVVESGPGVLLPVVASYRHLGCQQTPGGGLRAEVAYRITQARAAFAEGRHKVYRNPAISLGRKAFILRSAVLPKLYFGAGSWGPLNIGERRSISGALWSFYRSLLGIGKMDDQHMDAHTCFALLRLPSPSTALRFQRLLYVSQLLAAAPPELWACLRADRDHAELLLADLQWLHSYTWRTTGSASRADVPSQAALPGRGIVLVSMGTDLTPTCALLVPPAVRADVASGSFHHEFEPSIRLDVAAGLLSALDAVPPDDEETVWATVTSFVEPLETLRATVSAWKDAAPCCPAKSSTADNVLLLLDVDLLADTYQTCKPARAFPQDDVPAWTRPGRAAFALSGVPSIFRVEPPPPHVLQHDVPTSLCLKDAAAYSTWLEATCGVIAQCVTAAVSKPCLFVCPGVCKALGPAREWLRATGFEETDSGFRTPCD
ncbi:unnamed protein product [Symbiodinium sp. CCMP2592]|nr:unnamed protein product [Symbiodinium sp. CCMP2592]